MDRIFLQNKINERVSNLKQALENNPNLAMRFEIESLEDMAKILSRKRDANLEDIERLSLGHYAHHFEMSFDTSVLGKSLKDLRIEHGNSLDTIIGFKAVTALDTSKNDYVQVLDRELF